MVLPIISQRHETVVKSIFVFLLIVLDDELRADSRFS
jgi:hypothetical protein